MPRQITYGGQNVLTGIFKSPVGAPVQVGELGLAGDGQADLDVHGGRDKAVYVYPACHYAAWQRDLGTDLGPSQFGENLTVDGLSEETVIIGSRYKLGSAEMRVTQPRLPCFKLGIRMNDDSFPAQFLRSGRLGFYMRVEKAGVLSLNDRLTLLHSASHGITVLRLWEIVFGGNACTVEIQHAIDSLRYLDAGWSRRLRKLLKGGRH
jgi:MOSC domain-containing protein YiiM